MLMSPVGLRTENGSAGKSSEKKKTENVKTTDSTSRQSGRLATLNP
jgi:hypothetical protein